MIRLKMRDVFFILIGTPLLVTSFNNCAPYDESHMVFSENASLSSEATLLQEQAQAIYRAHACNGCHGSRPGTAGVYLFDTNQLIQNGHLIPGDPNASQVYINTGGGHNGVAAFAAADRQTIANWILALTPGASSTPTPTPFPTPTPAPGATPVPTPTGTPGPAPTPVVAPGATPTPAPTGPACTLIASQTSNVVPGDAVTITMTWPGSATDGTIDGMNYTLTGKTSQTKQVNPNTSTIYTASYTASTGVGTCSVSISTKGVSSLTKDEFYRATIGPNHESVANMIMIGRCQNCHSSTGNTPYSAAMAYWTVDPFSASVTLSHIKNVDMHNGTYLDLTVKTATSTGLYQYASGHKAKSPAYTSAELQHILTYVSKP